MWWGAMVSDMVCLIKKLTFRTVGTYDIIKYGSTYLIVGIGEK